MGSNAAPFRTGSINPEDDGCGDADGGHEGVGAAVVMGFDMAPVLEPAEHDLDLGALEVERGVVRDRCLAVALLMGCRR